MGEYDDLPSSIAVLTASDIFRTCWSAIWPLQELPRFEYYALRLGAADRWCWGSSWRLSRLLTCIGPEKVVSPAVVSGSLHCAAKAVRLGPVKIAPVLPSVRMGVVNFVWCSGN